MANCLTPQGIDRYRKGALDSADELLAVEGHLDACVDCRNALRADVRHAAVSLTHKLVPAVHESACLDANLLARYVNGKADVGDVEVVEIHTEDCPRCAQSLASLRASRQAVAPRLSPLARLRALLAPPRRVLSLAASGVTAMVAAAALVSLWNKAEAERARSADLQAQVAAAQSQLTQEQQARQRQLQEDRQAYGRQMARVRQETETVQEGLKVRIGNLERQLAARPHPPVLAQPPRNDAGRQLLQTLETAVLQGVVNLPAQVASLTQGTDRSGSSQGRPEISLLRPVATFVWEERPTLAAKPLDGATGYQVTIVNPDAPGTSIKTIPLSISKWKVANALQRGQVYEWWVTARKKDRDVSSPVARFRMLDKAQADAVTRAQRVYTGLPLTLGIVYAQAGLVDDAERAFQSVLKTNPKHPVATQLLRGLQADRPTVP